jgi:TIR domain
MDRTRVFISYSSADREWLDRLRIHLAVLERKELIDVWSDANIEVGATWKEEIEVALWRARIAVLMVSPAFLASHYVWQMEMPMIIAHTKFGMEVLPLIVRPCAWRLESDLERLQARPSLGRALSGGSDYQIDLDLSRFAYELAAKVGYMSSDRIVEENELAEAHRSERRSAGPSDRGSDRVFGNTENSTLMSKVIAGRGPLVWTGNYPATNARLRLRFESDAVGRINGTIEYLGEETVSNIQGALAETPDQLSPDKLWPDRSEWPETDETIALQFREVSIRNVGKRNVDLSGEYRAIASRAKLVGVWISSGRIVERFTMRGSSVQRPAIA